MRRLLWLTGLLFPLITQADQTIYCPQNHGYISIGMTQDQITAACGDPISKTKSNQPVMQKIPVTQLIYNNQGDKKAFYGVWSIPGGNTINRGPIQTFGGNSGGGSQLQINIINNKVSSVSLNGSDINAFSICGNTNIQVGDMVAKVYSACGSPSLVNNTYINQPIQSATQPEIWVYQPSPYQSPLNLTFIDGKLQSIN